MAIVCLGYATRQAAECVGTRQERLPVLTAERGWVVDKEVARPMVRVVGVADLGRCGARVKRTTVHRVASVVSHAAGLQVGTVIQPTLLPPEAAWNATGAGALSITNPAKAAHTAEGCCCTGTTAFRFTSAAAAITAGTRVVSGSLFAEVVMKAAG